MRVKKPFSKKNFQALEKNNEFEFIMISETILEKLEHIPKADDDIDYKDNQVYEDVDGYESLRNIFK